MKRLVALSNRDYIMKHGIAGVHTESKGLQLDCPLDCNLGLEKVANLNCKDINYRKSVQNQLVNPFCFRCLCMPAVVNGKYQMKVIDTDVDTKTED